MRRNGIPGMGGWFTNSAMAGGGPLIDLGVHVLDMALYLMGEPEVTTISASTYAEFGPRGIGAARDSRRVAEKTAYDVEDLATAFIRMRDGATLLLEASWATHSSASDDFGVILYGSEGGAAINVKNYTWHDTLRIYTNIGGVPADIAPASGKGDDHVGVIHDFVAAVRGGNWSAYDGSEGMTRARVIDACYASAQQGREVLFGEHQ
jgi:predicted dehydrogenase